jgi:cell wall assembly regulator SMI1
LPPSFAAVYAIHDGSQGPFECYDVGYYDLMSIDEILQDKLSFDSLEKSGSFARWAPGEWWNPAWIPFLTDHGRDRMVIDTAGSFGGVPGQVLKFIGDGASRRIVYPSFDGWLEVRIARLEAGLYDRSLGSEAWSASMEEAALKIARDRYPDHPRSVSIQAA